MIEADVTHTLFEDEPTTRDETFDLYGRVIAARHALWMNAVHNVAISREIRDRVWATWSKLDDRRIALEAQL